MRVGQDFRNNNGIVVVGFVVSQKPLPLGIVSTHMNDTYTVISPKFCPSNFENK